MPAPTFPAAADLVGGTGTRSFTAVTTQAGDWLVVELIVELGITGTPALSPLTWTQQNNRDDGANRTEVFQFTAQDATGGSRTIQIVPGTTSNYRARLTVVRGSAGPGTGKGTAAAQTVSVTRQAANSAMFMTVGDWAAGVVGTPVWAPGGATTASQRQTSVATYIHGRWDDSGAAATASHGISSPSYGTPSIAVLEMLGTASASTVNGAALAALSFTAAASGTPTVAGAAASTFGFAATAAGAVSAGPGTVLGLATAALAFTGTASGIRTVSATAATTIAFTGVAAGTRTVLGQVATTLAFSAVASGVRAALGAAAAPLAFVASASGQMSAAPGTVLGVATAPLIFSASASGVRTAFGQASVPLTFAAVATGSVSIPGGVVVRPDTGATVRPGSGTTARPSTGTTTRTTGTTVRPYSGTVTRP